MLSQNEGFQRLRELLYEHPRQKIWRQLCELLEGWSWERGLELALVYADEHLEPWPDALRMAPRAWVEDIYRDHEPPAAWFLVRAVEAPRAPSSQLLKLFETDLIEDIGHLDLSQVRLSEDAWNQIVHHPALRPHTLRLSHALPSPQACLRLFQVPFASGLRELDLSGHVLPQELLEESWHREDLLPHLHTLDLSNCQLGSQGANALSWCSALGQVRTLHLRSNGINSGGAIGLSKSPYLRQVESLNLSHNDVHRRGYGALCRMAEEGALLHLCLDANRLGSEGLPRIRTAPRLRSLSLRHNNISHDALSALCRSPGLAALERLDLAHNLLADFEHRRLIFSPHLPPAIKRPYLESWSNAALRDIAKERQIKLPRKLSRKEIIERLLLPPEEPIFFL